MRAKNLLKHAYIPHGGWLRPTDASKPMDELGRIIAKARSRYEAKRPSSQDIKQTLRALSQTPDGLIYITIQDLEQTIKAIVTTAALKNIRKVSHNTAFHSLMDLEPTAIRAAASEAFRDMPQMDGAHNKAQRDLDFAYELGQYWLKVTGKRPTVTKKTENSKESPYLTWALMVFHDAGRNIRPGRPLNSETLAPILRKSINKIR